VIEEKLGDEGVLAMLAQKQLRFPVICKPVQACGTAKSHNMVSVEVPSVWFTPLLLSSSRRLSGLGPLSR
jgi:hypothetical protein